MVCSAHAGVAWHRLGDHIQVAREPLCNAEQIKTSTYRQIWQAGSLAELRIGATSDSEGSFSKDLAEKYDMDMVSGGCCAGATRQMHEA